MDARAGEEARDAVATERMPGHWVLARVGKRVLRPGGVELTRRLVDGLAVTGADDVVELAPGLGITASLLVGLGPASYLGVEADASAAETARRAVEPHGGRIVEGRAQHVPLDTDSASVVIGEAMLSMQNDVNKRAILSEAARLLRPGGRLAIHELCLVPDDIEPALERRITEELSRCIHVGVRPLTPAGWAACLAEHGFEIVARHDAPMHLLSPTRVIRDEGVVRSLGIARRTLADTATRRRVHAMWSCFRRWGAHLGAVGLVASREGDLGPRR